MPLQKQPIPISFAGQLDTKTDFKQVVPGSFLVLENALYTSLQEIRKRFGFASFPRTLETGSSISKGVFVTTFKDELLMGDGKRLYSYSESNMKWTDKGPLMSLGLSISPVIKNSYNQTSPDSITHPSGLQLNAWEDSRGGVRYSVVDTFTGQTIVADKLLLTTAAQPKTVTIGQFLLLFFVNTANNHLQYIAIPGTTPLSPSAPADIATNIDVSFPNYDVCTLSSRLFITYNNTDVGGGISLRFMNAFLVVSAETDVTGENADVAINTFPDVDNQQVHVAYYNGTSVKAFIYDYSLATQVLPPTVIETTPDVLRITGVGVQGTGALYYEIDATLPSDHYIKSNNYSNTGSVASPGTFYRSVGIASKAVTYDNASYILATFETDLQPTYFLLRSDQTVVGKILPGNGGGLLLKSILPELSFAAASEIRTAVLQKDLLTTISGAVYTSTGVTVATIDFLYSYAFSRIEFNSNLHFSGAILSMYDGVNVVEHGFSVYPEGVTGTPSNVGGFLGSASVATQYQVSVCYEWTDQQGQIHRSNPSVPLTFNFTSGTVTGSIALVIPTLRLTYKADVRLVVYRTEGNGTIFYQDTSPITPLLNNTGVNTVNYTITTSDADIIGNPLLYTTGGVLPNIAAPATDFITSYKNRLVLIPFETKTTIWLSKTSNEGEPTQFTDFLTIGVDERGGDLVGLAQMDDKLVYFKHTNVLFNVFQGPDNAGNNNDIPFSQLLPMVEGCKNPRSIVLTDNGLLYQSQQGFYLLDRKLTAQYVGAPVEAFNEAVVTSARSIPTTTQVRFTLSDGGALMYDSLVNKWSTFTNHFALDSTIFQNLFTYVRTNGTVYQETPGAFSDDGVYIKLKVITGWLSLAGLAGYQRAYRALFLGQYYSPHKLLLKVAYDFNPSFVQENLIDSTDLYDINVYGEQNVYGSNSPYGGVYPQYEFRLDLARQKCEALQFSIEDIQSSPIGEGFSISAINLMVGAKVGSNKVPATRTFG